MNRYAVLSPDYRTGGFLLGSAFQLQKEVTARTMKKRKINGVHNTTDTRRDYTFQKGAF